MGSDHVPHSSPPTLSAGTVPVRESDLGQRLYERFLRTESVNGLAGAAKVQPSFVPIDFLLVTEQAGTFEDALAAMRWADKVRCPWMLACEWTESGSPTRELHLAL